MNLGWGKFDWGRLHATFVWDLPLFILEAGLSFRALGGLYG